MSKREVGRRTLPNGEVVVYYDESMGKELGFKSTQVRLPASSSDFDTSVFESAQEIPVVALPGGVLPGPELLDPYNS